MSTFHSLGDFLRLLLVNFDQHSVPPNLPLEIASVIRTWTQQDSTAAGSPTAPASFNRRGLLIGALEKLLRYPNFSQFLARVLQSPQDGRFSETVQALLACAPQGNQDTLKPLERLALLLTLPLLPLCLVSLIFLTESSSQVKQIIDVSLPNYNNNNKSGNSVEGGSSDNSAAARASEPLSVRHSSSPLNSIPLHGHHCDFPAAQQQQFCRHLRAAATTTAHLCQLCAHEISLEARLPWFWGLDTRGRKGTTVLAARVADSSSESPASKPDHSGSRSGTQSSRCMCQDQGNLPCRLHFCRETCPRRLQALRMALRRATQQLALIAQHEPQSMRLFAAGAAGAGPPVTWRLQVSARHTVGATSRRVVSKPTGTYDNLGDVTKLCDSALSGNLNSLSWPEFTPNDLEELTLDNSEGITKHAAPTLWLPDSYTVQQQLAGTSLPTAVLCGLVSPPYGTDLPHFATLVLHWSCVGVLSKVFFEAAATNSSGPFLFRLAATSLVFTVRAIAGLEYWYPTLEPDISATTSSQSLVNQTGPRGPFQQQAVPPFRVMVDEQLLMTCLRAVAAASALFLEAAAAAANKQQPDFSTVINSSPDGLPAAEHAMLVDALELVRKRAQLELCPAAVLLTSSMSNLQTLSNNCTKKPSAKISKK